MITRYEKDIEDEKQQRMANNVPGTGNAERGNELVAEVRCRLVRSRRDIFNVNELLRIPCSDITKQIILRRRHRASTKLYQHLGAIVLTTTEKIALERMTLFP